MEKKESSSFKYDTIDILIFLYKKRKPIIIVTILGAIASIIASLVITPKFKSTVILFPASQSSLSKTLLTDNPYKDDILQFGEEEDAERLIQVLYSDDIRNYIVDKYELYKHYDIDTTSAFPQTALFQEYKNNITFKKTEYQSIEIKVLDKDPITAANIANDIASLIDTVIHNMQQERAIEAYSIVKEQHDYFSNYIKSLEDSLKQVRENGVLDYVQEVQRFSQAYATALAKDGLSSKASILFEEKFKILKEHGGDYLYYNDLLYKEKNRLVDLNQKLMEAKVNAESYIPNKFVVNTALPAEKKSYPVRWLIVSISTLGAFVFSVFLVIILDFIKEVLVKIKKSKDEIEPK